MRRVASAFRNGLSRIYNGSAEDAILSIAEGLRRRHFQDGPPFDPRAFASSLGVPIERDRVTGSGALDGWSTGKPRIVLPPARPDTIGRRRENFTIAHELGHFLVRTQLEGCVPSRVLDGGHPEEEYLCNVFAAELLVPRRYFLNIIRTHGLTPAAILWLSEMCDVTTRVITRRIADVCGEQFIGIRWQRRGTIPECSWAEPRVAGTFEVPRTGRSTVERALQTSDEQEGLDTFLCGPRRVRWRCLSLRVGSSASVLTVGLRSATTLTLGSICALPDPRRFSLPQLRLF